MDNEQQNVILIADDHPPNVKLLFALLKGSGFKILVAKDGKDTLQKLERVLPDIILLDIMMPEMDGFETCQHIKSNSITQDIPVIFMTALNDKENLVKGLSVGAVDYITKPFQNEEVLARIKVHLQIRNLTKTLAEKNQLLAQSAEELEQKVADRTAALQQSLQELQQTQLQLVQSAKMSALGELTAGIGHEIKNPLNAILGNLPFLDKSASILFKLVSLYQEKFPEDDHNMLGEDEELEIEYLFEDLPAALASVKQGAEQIREITNSLRIFSRSDVDSRSDFDLREGLNSTLLILKHRLKANNRRPAVEVIKQYDPSLPLISCYPGQLSQVFTNILANSMDAFDEEAENRSFQENRDAGYAITVATEVIGPSDEPEHVIIRIQDNGPGIPPELQERIFEPSFTTKPVGKGTGLGLSICWQIVVERHQGELTCSSTPRTGTEFTIKLPVLEDD